MTSSSHTNNADDDCDTSVQERCILDSKCKTEYDWWFHWYHGDHSIGMLPYSNHMRGQRKDKEWREPKNSCGQFLGQISVSELRDVFDLFLNVLIPPHTAQEVISGSQLLLLNHIKHDVYLYKVCMSCQDVYLGMASGMNTSHFASYCGSEVHASDSVSFAQ